MKKSSKGRKNKTRWTIRCLTMISAISIAFSSFIIWYVSASKVEAKQWESEMKIEPILEVRLEQEPLEMDWSNFTSIAEEDMRNVKQEEELKREKGVEKLQKEEAEHDEVWYLAKTIHGEASICDESEKYRIGTVVMNRVQSPNYPNTVKGVVSSGAYSCYQDSRWYTEEPTQKEWQIARDIYENGVRVFESNVVYQAKHAFGNIVFVSQWHEFGAEE